MHELAIAESIVDAVTSRTGDRVVSVLHLRVGALSGVSVDALRFCFDVAAGGTGMVGARLDIAEPAGVARCHECGTDFPLDDPILLCPCGSANVSVLAGEDLSIVSVEVA